MEVLIIDNDVNSSMSLKHSLEQDEHEVSIINSGNSAIETVKKEEYDMIFLELDLIDVDGLRVCQKLREISKCPIIVITSRDDDMASVFSLEYGADDFIRKPYMMLELKARMKSILRRIRYTNESNNDHILKIDDLIINSLGRHVSIAGNELNLTAREFDLLFLLTSNPNRVYTREELLRIIWGYDYFGELRTVDVHIRRLREKIKKCDGSHDFIKTKWGKGYFFKKNCN